MSASTPIESKRSKSKYVVSYDDLPDLLLVEILCRLPSKEYVFQCKCVSKHWLNLISDPHFIGRFLHLQRCHKTPIAGTLMDRRGEEFPTPRTTQSSSNLLDPLFERLMSFHGLESKPYVIGTSNDLVLCCRTEYYENQREFYICNPCTRQWVALPPTTRFCTHVPVGFISDRYYEDEDSTIKKDFSCKVVRILPHDVAITSLNQAALCNFIVEVFCFATGEWRESIVSSPRNIAFQDIIGVAYNGMLYWPYQTLFKPYETGITRLDPFMIGNGSASSGTRNGDETVVDDDHYQFHLSDAVDTVYVDQSIFNILYVRRGRLQMWATSSWPDDVILVWELTGNDDHDHLGSPDKFYMKKVSAYPIESELLLHGNYREVALLALDPNDEDIFHVKSYGEIRCYFKLDIRTQSWSRVNCTSYFECWSEPDLYRLVLPLWPTPLRRLPLVEEYVEDDDFSGKSRKLLESLEMIRCRYSN